MFYDEDRRQLPTWERPRAARPFNLALTNPDLNEVVPFSASRFAGDFMLTSQGDLQQIFVSPWNHKLSVLSLTQSVDDTAWPDGSDGALYATDSTNDTVDVVTGSFPNGPVVAVTPCGSNSAARDVPGSASIAGQLSRCLEPVDRSDHATDGRRRPSGASGRTALRRRGGHAGSALIRAGPGVAPGGGHR